MKRDPSRSNLWRLSVATLLLAVATPAVAQVEVIQITAQRRDSTLQDTNLSVTTWDAAQLEDRQIEDMIDLREFVPNVTVEPNSNGNGFFIGSRGIAQADATLITRDPAVAVYIDGVYWGRTIGNLIDVLDIQRIEVLRGPQGALYGRNAAAGAVNFVTRKPSGNYGTKMNVRAGSGQGPNGFIGDFRAYQEFPIWGTQGAQVPEELGDLSGSVSFAAMNRDAWFGNNSSDFANPFTGTNYRNGPDTDGRKRLAGRVALLQTVGNFTASFSADYTYGKEQGPEMQLTELNPTGATLCVPPQTQGCLQPGGAGLVGLLNGQQSTKRKKNLNVLGSNTATTGGIPTQANGEGTVLPPIGLRKDKTQAWGGNLTLSYDFEEVPFIGGDATLKSITGYRDIESDTYQDRDGSPFDAFSNYLLDDIHQVTQEVTLVGQTGEVSYVLGHFYLYEKGNQEAGQWAYGGFGQQASLAYPHIKTQAQAIFGHFTFQPEMDGWFKDRLTFEVGVRQTWETKDISSSTINLTTVAGLPPEFGCETGGVSNLSYGWSNCATGQNPERTPVRGRKSFNKFTPSGTIAFDLHETSNAYFSVSQGFMAGGFNGRANTPDELVNPYAPEVQLNFEGGFKYRSPDGDFRMNIAGYFTTIDNLQRTQLSTVPGTQTVSSIIRNAAQAEIRGVEIEAIYNPVENLFLNFSYGLAKSEYERYCDSPTSGGVGVANSKCPTGELDFANSRRLANVPTNNISWGIAYSLPVGDLGFISASEISGRIDGYWQSQTYLQNGNRKFAGNPDYHLLNMRLVLREIELPGDAGNFDLAIWGRNLTDESYRPFGIDFDSNEAGNLPYVVQYFGERRTVGAELIWRFGAML